MKTITVATKELEGISLDWAVAIATKQAVWCEQGMIFQHGDGFPEYYQPSANWNQAGKLIEQYNVWLSSQDKESGNRVNIASCSPHVDAAIQQGQTALIAACRAIVMMALGACVEIPDLIKGRYASDK
ncbi:phage protein NinX family protein [Nissabacter sp. SGAir0207]|uniref:phage protein NinX family protein n=1 Tax=Nissabacter sp. SGAir0207 TaxID=2126321 RepID=UPI00143DEA88|nr:phage protein NinX family protein [Nissabacter sp. SGAir0207]